jgi:hypothetical protein
MKQRFAVLATCVFAGTLISPERVQGQSKANSANAFRLSVQIYNWAKIPRVTLQKGQAVAGEIFKEAGVELTWAECPCEARLETMTLSLRIIPKLFGSTTSTFRSDHLGFAAVTEEGGVLATVFYDRIESLGKGGDLSGILGLAMAHELGHLLLGSKAHSDEGIMRPHWTRKDLRQAELDSEFTPGQADAIRERVADYHRQRLTMSR